VLDWVVLQGGAARPRWDWCSPEASLGSCPGVSTACARRLRRRGAPEGLAVARRLLISWVEVTIMPNNAMPLPEKSSLAHAVQQPKQSSAFENEGEGSRSAARNYDKATAQYVKSGRVEEAAKKAEAALDGPEGDELREAELAAQATVPGDNERPTNPMAMVPDKPKDERDKGFEEPELMKDESEDRE
jgi:hypothetical protein